MEKLIPKINEELITEMKRDNFKGDFSIKNNIVIWNTSSEVFLKIILDNQLDESYISYNCKINNKEIYLSHEHKK
ncbi:MAG: hypothetical protein OSJ70_07140 [Bacilli bacterium]|nr:hypothetical protein [Bacilli bacterium]